MDSCYIRKWRERRLNKVVLEVTDFPPTFPYVPYLREVRRESLDPRVPRPVVVTVVLAGIRSLRHVNVIDSEKGSS